MKKLINLLPFVVIIILFCSCGSIGNKQNDNVIENREQKVCWYAYDYIVNKKIANDQDNGHKHKVFDGLAIKLACCVDDDSFLGDPEPDYTYLYFDDEADYNADEADAAYQAFEDGEKYSPVQNSRHSGGFDVSCEVTPHHLALCGTDEPYIRALVNPPLRSEDDRVALLEALRDGTVDVISTDHAPHTLDDKAAGAPGFTGLETAYAVCNSVLVKDNQFNPRRLSQLMSAQPARLLGLHKGLLRPGYDADLTLRDPDVEWTVDSSKFYSEGKATPFEGRRLTGKVKDLFIDGRLVFES